MKRKLMGWAATAALTLVSANAMAQQDAVNRAVDNTQRKVDSAQRNADNAQRNAQNAAQDNLNRPAAAQPVPGQAVQGQQVPGRQTPQNLPDPQGKLNNQPQQTFAPPAGANVQGQAQGQLRGQGLQGNLNAQPGMGVNGGGALANVDPNIRWRYRQQNGRWMYWQPSNQWVVWTNNQWLPYSQAFAQPGFQQPGFQQQGYGPQAGFYGNQTQYGQQPTYGNQQFSGNRACNQSASGYTGQTYPNTGANPYAAGQQPGFGGPAPYASGYRGIPQNANVNPNAVPQTRGQAGAGVQGQSPIEPDVNSTPANRDTGTALDRNSPKPAPSDAEKQE